MFERMTRAFNYNENLIPPEPNFFTAGFVMDREDRCVLGKTQLRYDGGKCASLLRYILKDRQTFFTGAQRSMIVWQILMRTRYDPEDKDRVGIRRLLSHGSYKWAKQRRIIFCLGFIVNTQTNHLYRAAYPLHDGSYDVTPEHGLLSDRRVSEETFFHDKILT